MLLIDGKVVAKEIQQEIKSAIEQIEGRKPGLAVILVGDLVPSQTYVKMKRKACLDVGMHSVVHHLPETITQAELVHEVSLLNEDEAIDGILVQLPLPKHINPEVITEAICPQKDVDGLHPFNMGKLLLGQKGGFAPCTPQGVKLLLDTYNIPVNGKHVIIIGRSNLVGKPLAAILMQKDPSCNATVTLAHSGTKGLKELCLQADILIAAIGQARFVTEDMIKEGAVVIDVGIAQIPDSSTKSGYRLVGDVDFDQAQQKCSAITPVPGGVGPMTIAQLLSNTLLSFQRKLVL